MLECIKTILLGWKKSKKVKKLKNQSKNSFFINLNFRGAPNPLFFYKFNFLIFSCFRFWPKETSSALLQSDLQCKYIMNSAKVTIFKNWISMTTYLISVFGGQNPEHHHGRNHHHANLLFTLYSSRMDSPLGPWSLCKQKTCS